MVDREVEGNQVKMAEAHRKQSHQGHVDQGQHQNPLEQQEDQPNLLLNHHAIQITTQITVSGRGMTVHATQNVTIKNVDGMEEIAKRSQLALTCLPQMAMKGRKGTTNNSLVDLTKYTSLRDICLGYCGCRHKMYDNLK